MVLSKKNGLVRKRTIFATSRNRYPQVENVLGISPKKLKYFNTVGPKCKKQLLNHETNQRTQISLLR